MSDESDVSSMVFWSQSCRVMRRPGSGGGGHRSGLVGATVMLALCFEVADRWSLAHGQLGRWCMRKVDTIWSPSTGCAASPVGITERFGAGGWAGSSVRCFCQWQHPVLPWVSHAGDDLCLDQSVQAIRRWSDYEQSYAGGSLRMDDRCWIWAVTSTTFCVVVGEREGFFEHYCA